MIIGLTGTGAVIGSIERIDLYIGSTLHTDVPVMILRTATKEEWLVSNQEKYDLSQEVAERILALRLAQYPDARFYEVSVD